MKELLAEILRRSTQETHQSLDNVGYIDFLRKSSLRRTAVFNHLNCLAIVHAAFERYYFTSRNSLAARAASVYESKLSALQSDVQLFQEGFAHAFMPAIQGSLALADRIIEHSLQSPEKLTGYLYVLEGALHGGAQIGSVLAELFPDTAPGLQYFSWSRRPSWDWGRFRALLNEVEDVPAQTAAVEGALEAMLGFGDIFTNLVRLNSPDDLKAHIAIINPEAGSHAIPEDPEWIVAAVRAANQCWREFPELEAQFGERGRRFSLSDGCWILTLGELELPAALAQLKWLKSVLESRGIPGAILVRKLEILHTCLQDINAREFHHSYTLLDLGRP